MQGPSRLCRSSRAAVPMSRDGPATRDFRRKDDRGRIAWKFVYWPRRMSERGIGPLIEIPAFRVCFAGDPLFVGDAGRGESGRVLENVSKRMRDLNRTRVLLAFTFGAIAFAALGASFAQASTIQFISSQNRIYYIADPGETISVVISAEGDKNTGNFVFQDSSATITDADGAGGCAVDASDSHR